MKKTWNVKIVEQMYNVALKDRKLAFAVSGMLY